MIDGMDDERLLAELREALERVDPVPPEVTLAARSALAWRRMDAGLAELLHDSAMETEAAGTRSTAHLRFLRFGSAEGLSLELEIAEDADRRRLLGQVIPPGAARILVRHPGGVIAVESDELGRFRAEGMQPGPMSLRCEPPRDAAVESGWVVI